MPELVHEFLTGPAGRTIDNRLLALITQMDKSAVAHIRDGKPYDDVRYQVGIADGVRLALNAIHEIAKS